MRLKFWKKRPLRSRSIYVAPNHLMYFIEGIEVTHEEYHKRFGDEECVA